jgi:hypothetical protein
MIWKLNGGIGVGEALMSIGRPGPTPPASRPLWATSTTTPWISIRVRCAPRCRSPIRPGGEPLFGNMLPPGEAPSAAVLCPANVRFD